MLTDRMIAQAAAEAMEIRIAKYEAEFENLPPHRFSSEFERKIAKLKRKADHPILYRTLYRVASIILAVLIDSGVWLAFDTDARAAFFGWVKEKFESYFVYSYNGGAEINEEPKTYSLTFIPDGYTEHYSKTFSDRVTVVYTNEKGEMLKFNYSYTPDKTNWFIKAENTIVEHVTVNGSDAEVLLSTEQGRSTTIVWVAPDNTAFNISGFFSVEDLIMIAESVK